MLNLIMTITFVPQDEMNAISSAVLSQCTVPDELIAFYEVDEIQNMGEQLHSNIYALDGLLFKVRANKILKAYFPIEYLKKYPNLL